MKRKPFITMMVLLGLVLGSVVAGPTPAPASLAAPAAVTYYVREGGSGNCLSWDTACELQDALDAASDGDQIWVAAGTYKPTQQSSPPDPRSATFQLESGVALYGGFPATGDPGWDARDWVAHEIILSGDIGASGNNSDNSYHVVTGSGVTETAVLDGFTITGGSANGSGADSHGGGMVNSNSSPMLTNVIFSGNQAIDGGGMYNDSSSPTLTNVAFSGNEAGAWGGGMYNITNSSPVLTNVTFSGNSAGGAGGMFNNGGSPTLTNCILWGNDALVGAQVYNVISTPVIAYSDVEGSGGSVSWDTNLGTDGGGNIDADPLFLEPVDPATAPTNAGNLRLQLTSPAIDAGNNDAPGLAGITTDLGGHPRFVDVPAIPDTGSGTWPIVDMGAYETPPPVIYVDREATGANDGSSWQDAFADLQDAFTWAVSGVEIWVTAGTYTPGTAREATFRLVPGVAVYGGFDPSVGDTAFGDRDWAANLTVLSGDLDGDDGPDFANNEENSYHVVSSSGLTETAVLDGFTITGGNADGGVPPQHDGGGMYNDGSSPTVTHCTFEGNSAGSAGGGMYNVSNSSPMLTNVIFSGNQAIDGGGMYNVSNSSPQLIDATFSGNHADRYGGGMRNDSSSPTLTNVAFSGNEAGAWGGGMYNITNSSPVLTNVTFSGNSAGGAGGMYNSGGSATLTNCILWGNDALVGAQVYNEISTPVIAYSDVEGSGGSVSWDTNLGTDGGGNIDADPLFLEPVDPATAPTNAGNLRLQPTSPAIDAGNNDAPGLAGITTDLDGHPRFVDVPAIPDTGSGTWPIVDMGAYETPPPVIYIVYLPLVLRNAP